MKKALILSTLFASGLLLTNTFAQIAGNPGQAQTPGNPSQAQTQPTVPRQTPDAMDNAANNSAGSQSKVDDKKFVKDAAMGGLAEVELGKLALQKAAAENVKQFAQRMIDDHSKANDQLKQVASKDSIPVPDTLDSKYQSKMDKLSKLSGAQFDKAYIKDQLKDHETDVKEFNAEAQNGTDPNVKAFASSTLPILQQHLEMVKSLNKSEKQMAKNSQ